MTRFLGTKKRTRYVSRTFQGTHCFQLLNWLNWFPRLIISFPQQSPYEGAQTTIHLALAPELANTTGKYFMDCKEAKPGSHTRNPVLQRKIWEMSEKVLGLA